MDTSDRYIPKKGDIVWVNFDPSSGNEIKKRRPGLVVSRYEFNRSTLFAVICPITSTIKNIPTRYTLPKEMVVTGQIVISQLKSLDFHARKIEYNLLPLAKRNLHLLPKGGGSCTGANKMPACEISKEKFGTHNYVLLILSKLVV